MARVQSYNKDASLDVKDKLLGSSFISTSNGADVFQTGNFTLGDLAQFFANYNESEGSVYNLAVFDQSITTNATNISSNSTYATNLASTFGTFDANGNLQTLAESFANQVFTTTTNAKFAESTYVTALQSNFGTFDANGNLTALSQAFANQVFTTTTNTDFAASSALTALESTVTAQGVTIGGLSTSIATANSNITTNSTAITANSTATTSLTAVVDLKPLTFRQNNAPAVTEPVGSIWFDSNDNNKIYILTAGSPNVWTETFDGRIAVNTTAISAANTAITANSTANTANASSITNLTSTVTANKTEQDNLPAIFRQDNAPATTHPLNSLWYDTNDGNKLYVMITTAGTKSWAATQDLGLNTLITNNATSIGTNATGISNNSTAIANNLTSIGLTPKVFRQNAAPAVTEPVSSIWYDANDNNKPYILVAGSPNVWTSTVDPRIGSTVTGLANAVSDISTNSNTISANAAKREELEAVFSFDSNSPAQVTGVAGALNTSINNAASSAVQATANSLDKLEAVFSQDSNGDVTGITGALSTAVTTHAGTAITNASLAAAADVTELQTQFTFSSGNITGVTDTLNTVINTAQSDAESASATKIDSLASNFFTGYDNSDGTFTAVNVSEAFANDVFTTTTNSDFASTSSVTTLSALVGNSASEGLRADIITNASTIATVEGYAESRYSLNVAAGNVVTGMSILAANGTTSNVSEVKFQADKFIINSSSSNLTPFSISGGVIQINGQLNVSGTASIKGSSNTGQFIACDFKNTGSSGLSSIRVLNSSNYYGLFRLNTTVSGDIGYYGIDLVIGPDTGGGEKRLANFNGGGISLGTYSTGIFFNDAWLGGTTNNSAGGIRVKGSSDGQATQAMFITVPSNQSSSTPALAIEDNSSNSLFKVFKNSHVETGSIQTSGNITGATLSSNGTITATGAITSNSTVTGTQFIDKNNSAYYLDPGSTSNLNAATLIGTFIGVNGYFSSSLGLGFNSGSIGAKLHIERSSAGIGIKNDYGSTVSSNTIGLLQYTSAAATSSGYHLVFQAAPSSGSDTNMLLCNLNGNLRNRNNSYGQYSDQNIKENITDATPKLEDVKKLKVKNFNFIGDDLKQIGLIAQETELVFPGLVEDDLNPQGDQIKSLKYSVLVPILIKAIQELEARVATLEG